MYDCGSLSTPLKLLLLFRLCRSSSERALGRAKRERLTEKKSTLGGGGGGKKFGVLIMKDESVKIMKLNAHTHIASECLIQEF
jgi:uncharacterized spore protein YtfJ